MDITKAIDKMKKAYDDQIKKTQKQQDEFTAKYVKGYRARAKKIPDIYRAFGPEQSSL